MDYKTLYPNSGDLFDDCSEFKSKIIDIFEQQIKDTKNKEIFEELKKKEYITESKFPS